MEHQDPVAALRARMERVQKMRDVGGGEYAKEAQERLARAALANDRITRVVSARKGA